MKCKPWDAWWWQMRKKETEIASNRSDVAPSDLTTTAALAAWLRTGGPELGTVRAPDTRCCFECSDPLSSQPTSHPKQPAPPVPRSPWPDQKRQ